MNLIETYASLYFVSVVFLLIMRDTIIDTLYEGAYNIQREVSERVYTIAIIIGSLAILGVFIMGAYIVKWVVELYQDIKIRILIWVIKRKVNKICKNAGIDKPF